MVVTVAASEIKPKGKKVSIGGPRRAVLVLSSPQKVFSAKSDRFIGGPDKISGDVMGVIVGILTEKPWIVGVYIAVDQGGENSHIEALNFYPIFFSY
jgi:hypothetical protein